MKGEQVKSKNKFDFQVDFVIPWVDGSDEEWSKKKDKYLENKNQGSTEERYRDFGTLRYLLRSIEKYANWFHKIYLITDNQIPEWLQLNERICVVDHTEYIPKKFLPTFNSNVIELNIWRIHDLSEHFILLNDDLLFTKKTSKKDFFTNDGMPRDITAQSILMPRDDFSHIAVNNISLINNLFNKREWLRKNWQLAFSLKNGLVFNTLSLIVSPLPYFTRFVDPHIGIAYIKQNFIKIWEIFPERLTQTSVNRFRKYNEVSHWLVRYYQIVSGQVSPRSYKFSKYYDISDVVKLKKEFAKPTHKMIVLNDGNLNNDTYKLGMETMVLLDTFLHNYSQFEKKDDL